jgi:hypothetical protein
MTAVTRTSRVISPGCRDSRLQNTFPLSARLKQNKTTAPYVEDRFFPLFSVTLTLTLVDLAEAGEKKCTSLCNPEAPPGLKPLLS